MRLSSLVFGIYLLCGAATGWLVAGLVPAGLRGEHLYSGDFKLTKPLEVTEARWCLMPFLFADFDMQMDVELGENTDLDILLRQVEPRLVDNQLLPFTGRFSVLRLTTAADGPAWRTRDEALTAPRGGGVGLAAGRIATVWIEARGKSLRANVAGKKQPWFTADDEYGMFTMVAKGGKAVVQSLTIQHLGQPRAWIWSRWFWVALGAAGSVMLAAVVRARGAHWHHLAAGVMSPALAWLLTRRVDMQLGWPDPAAMACWLGACLLASLCWLRTWRFALLAAIGVALFVAGDRWLARDTRVADALLGPKAGAQASEFHAQLVRGPAGIDDVGVADKKVMLLGGQLLYDRGLPAEHLGLLLASELRQATKQRVVTPCLPTADGHAQQQWRLFTTFFTGYRPAAIVLGVGRGEDAFDESLGGPRSSRAQLANTIAAARAHVAANGGKLVLFTEAEVAPELLLVLKEQEVLGVPLVIAAAGDTPVTIAKRLAAAVLPALR